ncbi:hypothetical protein ABKN59_005012 [Abortiporus biennis]
MRGSNVLSCKLQLSLPRHRISSSCDHFLSTHYTSTPFSNFEVVYSAIMNIKFEVDGEVYVGELIHTSNWARDGTRLWRLRFLDFPHSILVAETPSIRMYPTTTLAVTNAPPQSWTPIDR